MPTLPIPVFAAIILAFLGLRAWRREETPPVFLALIALCAVQAAVAAGRQHYGIVSLNRVQPVLALCIPALAWIAFITTLRRPLAISELWHLAGPLTGIFCIIFAPVLLDQVIVVAFVAYGAAILWAVRQGQGDLAHARIGAGEGLARMWRWIGVALIALAASDLIIYLAAAAGLVGILPWLMTAFSTRALLALGLLGLQEDMTVAPEAEAAAVATETDAALVAAMDAVMMEKRLWLDPDFTLARIARCIAVPAKALSAAINRVRGENVSRVVNGWRIAEACTLLRSGEGVTQAMLASGFNTKSNFNREFLRVMGVAPTEWLADAGQDIVDKSIQTASSCGKSLTFIPAHQSIIALTESQGPRICVLPSCG